MSEKISPDLVRQLLAQNDPQTLDSLVADTPRHEMIDILALLKDPEVWAVLRRVQSPHDAELFNALPLDRKADLVFDRHPVEVAQLAAVMPSDERADLLLRLPPRQRKKILETFAPELQAKVEKLIAYGESSVGSVMSTEFVALPSKHSVSAAISRLRNSAAERQPIYYNYVVGDDGKLLGIVSLRDLMLADPSRSLADVMSRDIVTLHVDDDRNVAAKKIRAYDLLALPVVQGDDRLVGVVTVDDVIDVVEEEASDTMLQKAGVGDVFHFRDHVYSQKLVQGSIWYPVRVRIIFLLVTLVGGLAVGGLIEFFEDTLAALLAAAVFIPLIMDMGGNVGTQSTTIFARAYALGQINLSAFFRKHVAREVLTGVCLGAILGTTAGVIAYFWQGVPNDVPQLGMAVGLSLFTVCITATFLGFMIPWAMLKLGLDHAPGTDPFITTIKDFTGLALYFWLVSVLIGVGPGQDDEDEDAEARRPVPALVVSA